MDGDNLNNVLGVIQRRTVFDHLVREDCNKFLRQLMRPALLVSEAWGGINCLIA